MTETEKLRALLAEAREALATDDVGAAFRAARRIDAALAEPVETPAWYETYRDEHQLRLQMERERDEARAEVERLRNERDEAVDDCELLVREVHALGAGASVKSLFNGRQRVAPAGSTPSPAPISDYRKSYALMFRRAERERDEAREENAAWRKATGRDDPEALDSYLGRAGIDAHLNVVTALMTKIEAERDEARAEVEVLRGVGCQTADKAGEEPSGPCGLCRKCAYRRGAETMREAAIQLVESML